MPISPERQAQIQQMLQQPAAPATGGSMTPERRAQIDALIKGAQATPQVQTQEPATPAQPGMLQGFLQGVAKPFEKLGASIAGIGEGAFDLLKGDVRGANQALSKERDFGYFGKARPIGINQETGQQMGAGGGIKDILGTGAELGSYLIGGEGVGGVARATLGGAVKQGVKTGVTTGLIGGALQGGGAEAQNPESTLGSIAGQTAIGGGIGAATGGVIGGALPIAGAGVRKVAGVLTSEGRASSLVANRLSAIDKLESGNATIRKAFAGAERQGHDIKNILASEDWITGSVDNNGKIRTTKPGGAIDKLEATIAPAEDVVMSNIRREGKSVSAQEVEQAMLDNIDSSNIAGAAKTTAETRARNELAAMRRNPDGSIPVEELQKLKIYKGKNTNYLDPDVQNADKAITNALKTLIENNVDSIEVKARNAELAKFYALRGVLRKLDGKTVEGGKLGKYFSQIVGAAAGGQVGGPMGAIVGAELGGRIRGGLLKNTLRKGTGKLSGLSDEMLRAVETGKSPLPTPELIPESRRLMAPAMVTPPPADASRLYTQEEARGILAHTLNPKLVEPQRNILGIENKMTNKPQPIQSKASNISESIAQGIPKKANTVNTPKIDINSVESINSEIARRVEKFRGEAGLMANKEGAGVRLRTPDNGLDTPNTDTFTSFSLNRAKGQMKYQAESGKRYAHTALYESDPEFRSLVDIKDKLLETKIASAKTADAADEIFRIADKEEQTILKEVKQYEQANPLDETPSTPKENKGNGAGKEKGTTQGVGSPLLSEAKKYKTAEEFVDGVEFGDSKVKQTVYHQTDADFSEFKEMLKPFGFRNSHFFLGESPTKIVRKNLVEAKVNIVNPLIIKESNITQPMIDDAIKAGYDGIIHKRNGKPDEIAVFNTSQIKTKSQLLDIYKKAHGK